MATLGGLPALLATAGPEIPIAVVIMGDALLLDVPGKFQPAMLDYRVIGQLNPGRGNHLSHQERYPCHIAETNTVDLAGMDRLDQLFVGLLDKLDRPGPGVRLPVQPPDQRGWVSRCHADGGPALDRPGGRRPSDHLEGAVCRSDADP